MNRIEAGLSDKLDRYT